MGARKAELLLTLRVLLSAGVYYCLSVFLEQSQS